MTFDQILTGTALFVDANILVYHFLPHPTLGPACKQLVERVTRQELTAFTSAHALADMAHRLMTMEATVNFGWPFKGIAARLRKGHARIPSLVGFQRAVGEVPLLGIQVLPSTGPSVVDAAALCRQYELLIGDALVVAVMRNSGLTVLASHDADFDRVPGVTRYAPA